MRAAVPGARAGSLAGERDSRASLFAEAELLLAAHAAASGVAVAHHDDHFAEAEAVLDALNATTSREDAVFSAAADAACPY